MKRNSVYLIVFLAVMSVACFNLFSPSCVGAACSATSTQVQGNQPTPTPSPSPSPSATPTPLVNCQIDFLVFDSGPTVLAVGEVGEFQLTPWQRIAATGELIKVADSCNIPKAEFVDWKSSSTIGVVTRGPGGFSASVKRLGIGSFTVTASLEGRSVSRTIN